MSNVDIVTSESADEDVGGKSVCTFCLKQVVKYTCPRCNVGYCCVECYRSPKHSHCSEEFYKQCFMEGLKESEADPEDKQRVLEMLKRAENDPDLNDLDQPEDDLEERLTDLDLDKDTDKIWNRLTDQERKEFEAMAGDGRLGKLVEIWTPWWEATPPLVQEIYNQSVNKEEAENQPRGSQETDNKSLHKQEANSENQSRGGQETDNQSVDIQEADNQSRGNQKTEKQTESEKDKSHSHESNAVNKQPGQINDKKRDKSKLVTKSNKSKTVKQSDLAILSESDSVSALNQSDKFIFQTDLKLTHSQTHIEQQLSTSGKPALKMDIQNISDLLRTKPSADIKYNAINVLYSYVFICRLHNGEHLTMAADSAEDLLDISDVMSCCGNMASTREAIQACLSRIENKSCFQTTREYNITIIKDLVNLICFSDSENPVHSILLALSDIYMILKTALRTCSKSLKSNKSESVKSKLKGDKSRLFKSMKKCEFMLSWSQSYGIILKEMISELELENSFLSAELEAVNLSKQQLETEWGGITKPKKRSLIEEL